MEQGRIHDLKKSRLVERGDNARSIMWMILLLMVANKISLTLWRVLSLERVSLSSLYQVVPLEREMEYVVPILKKNQASCVYTRYTSTRIYV